MPFLRRFLFRFVMVIEAILLLAGGILCLLFPHWPNSVSEVSDRPLPVETYARCGLGLGLLALAIPLFHVIILHTLTDAPKFHQLTLAYAILPAVCSIALAFTGVPSEVNAPSPMWWCGAIAISIMPIAVWTWVLLRDRNVVPPDAEPRTQKPLNPAKGTFEQELKLHQARMTFAWDWFHYHADQRLRAFNFCLVVLGTLVVVYGTAFREGQVALAAGVAICGVIVSIAFWLIEIRNIELVECGRKWLDYLEGGIGMELRKDDRKRACLKKATSLPERLGRYITHTFCFSLIYFLAFIGFVVAAFGAFL